MLLQILPIIIVPAILIVILAISWGRLQLERDVLKEQNWQKELEIYRLQKHLSWKGIIEHFYKMFGYV